MRVTQRSGRIGSARHNDRSFMEQGHCDRADHIDHERTKLNRVIGAREGMTLAESELAFYRERYSAALEEKNARYKAQRHPERCRTIDDLYKNKKTRPRETILQIGDMNESVSLDVFIECVNDYLEKINKWNNKHGNHLVIMNASLHADEATPHVHIRSVWEFDNPTGHKDLGQNKALKQAGISLPDPTKEESRYNNRMITVEKEHREIWQKVCIEHGLEIETEPLPRRKHLNKADYIAEQKQKEIDKLDKTKKEMIIKINSLVDYHNNLNDTIDELERNNLELALEIVEQEKNRDNILGL